MCLSGFPALRSSHRHGDVSAGPTFCRSSRKVLQIKYHTPESRCWPQTAYCSLNVCLTLAFFKGFKKLPQTAHQHGEGRTGESSPPPINHFLSLSSLFFYLSSVVCVSLCAGWSSVGVAGFWRRDGLWFRQGIQVIQRCGYFFSPPVVLYYL